MPGRKATAIVPTLRNANTWMEASASAQDCNEILGDSRKPWRVMACDFDR